MINVRVILRQAVIAICTNDGGAKYEAVRDIFNFLHERNRPTITCLCGSTRFYEEFRKANLSLTLAGNIVLSIGCDFKSDDGLGLTAEDKKRLDALHKCKIDLADEIFVLNVDGYIGESTRSEIEHAKCSNKRIKYLVDPK